MGPTAGELEKSDRRNRNALIASETNECMTERKFWSRTINSFLVWTADFIALLNIVFMHILSRTKLICNKVLFYTRIII